MSTKRHQLLAYAAVVAAFVTIIVMMRLDSARQDEALTKESIARTAQVKAEITAESVARKEQVRQQVCVAIRKTETQLLALIAQSDVPESFRQEAIDNLTADSGCGGAPLPD